MHGLGGSHRNKQKQLLKDGAVAVKHKAFIRERRMSHLRDVARCATIYEFDVLRYVVFHMTIYVTVFHCW